MQDLHRKCEREHNARQKEYVTQINKRKDTDATRLVGTCLARYHLTEFALSHLQSEFENFAGQEIQPVLPPYPQVRQTLVYEALSPERAHCVTITKPAIIHCSCNFPQTMGLPCRHVLLTNLCRDDRRLFLDLSQINSRWFLDRSPPSIVCPESKDSPCSTAWVPMTSVTWNSQVSTAVTSADSSRSSALTSSAEAAAENHISSPFIPPPIFPSPLAENKGRKKKNSIYWRGRPYEISAEAIQSDLKHYLKCATTDGPNHIQTAIELVNLFSFCHHHDCFFHKHQHCTEASLS